jgi:hypothetical protein
MRHTDAAWTLQRRDRFATPTQHPRAGHAASTQHAGVRQLRDSIEGSKSGASDAGPVEQAKSYIASAIAEIAVDGLSRR